MVHVLFNFLGFWLMFCLCPKLIASYQPTNSVQNRNSSPTSVYLASTQDGA